jgi:hypothetical protein
MATRRRAAPASSLLRNCVVIARRSARLIVGKLLSSVHILFTRARLLAAASGRRLETAEKADKKKSELYFCARGKKFLTEKMSRAARLLLPLENGSRDCFEDELWQ